MWHKCTNLKKKSSLNAKVASNYHSITLSSVHTTIAEMVMWPQYNQFGFRTKHGTSFGFTLLNDSKCFDCLWHPDLCIKLKDKIPNVFRLFLVKWYNKLLLNGEELIIECFRLLADQAG